MRPIALQACLLALTLAVPAFAASASDTPQAKPLKTVIGSIRQSKDDRALTQFADEDQARYLLGDTWTQSTPAQRKEFTELFHTLFAKMAFPKVRENFKNLDSILYTEPTAAKDAPNEAEVGSTILINHPLKKQELKLLYRVAKNPKGEWKVVDVKVLGDSMLQGIRDDQVRPILKEGGMEGLLQAMRAKVKELGGQK